MTALCVVANTEEGVNAIAAPIAKSDGGFIAAVGAAGPLHRLTPEKVMCFPDIARGIAREVSRRPESVPLKAL